MSDEGFDFRGPPPRRDPRPFEPPPWERDQFEQLARERAEQERAAALAAAEIAMAMRAAKDAEEGDASSLGALDGTAAGSPSSGPDGTTAERMVSEQPGPTASATAGAGAEKPKVELDEKQVTLMLLQLRSEEPEVLKGAWAVGFGAGMTLAVVGLVAALWGTIALTKRGMGPAGVFGGGVLVVLGLAFIGIGGWLIYGALRQRGVL